MFEKTYVFEKTYEKTYVPMLEPVFTWGLAENIRFVQHALVYS